MIVCLAAIFGVFLLLWIIIGLIVHDLVMGALSALWITGAVTLIGGVFAVAYVAVSLLARACP